MTQTQIPGSDGQVATPRQAATQAWQQLHAALPDAVAALRRNLSCGDPATEVHAAAALLGRVGAPQAAYSFTGHLSNQTNLTLTLVSHGGGHYTSSPPQTVAPGGTADWASDYDGFDFEGEVTYQVAGTPPGTNEVRMTWDIPLFGNNSIKVSTTISGAQARYEGGRGWHAEVWYYLTAS
jgi:hypothetical protein